MADLPGYTPRYARADLTYIWAAIIARFAYHTPIHWVHVLGWLLHIVGMGCMGWTPRDTEHTMTGTRFKTAGNVAKDSSER